MTKIDITETTRDDIPGLQAVLEATGLFPPELLPDFLEPVLTGDSPALWRTGWVDGTPAGLVFTEPEPMTDGTWNMRALGVVPGHQGRGLGRAVVAAVEEDLASAGQRILIVDTSGTADFAGARAFYAALGYDEEARIRDFWAEGDDKVTFRKPLER